MDSFDEKHKMMGQLLEMLKRHASDEVSNGLQKPEGEGDMHGLQIEKVEVLPGHEMDEPTPEHAVKPEGPEGKPLTEMNKGGYVPKGDQPIHYEQGGAEGHPDTMAPAHGETIKSPLRGTPEEQATPMDDEYNEAPAEPSSMFQNFLSRKKKK